jgi:hypothetical protein
LANAGAASESATAALSISNFAFISLQKLDGRGHKSFNFSVNFGTAFVRVGYGRRSQHGVQSALEPARSRVCPTLNRSDETGFISVALYTKSFV